MPELLLLDTAVRIRPPPSRKNGRCLLKRQRPFLFLVPHRLIGVFHGVVLVAHHHTGSLLRQRDLLRSSGLEIQRQCRSLLSHGFDRAAGRRTVRRSCCLYSHVGAIGELNCQDISLVRRAGNNTAFDKAGQLVIACHRQIIPTCFIRCAN